MSEEINQTAEAGSRTSDVWLAALAGLLHDVGKFTGRAGVGQSVEFVRNEQRDIGYKHAEDSGTFVDSYVPEHLRKGGIQAVRYHHKPGNIPTERQEIKLLAHLVRLADVWAAGERQAGAIERSKPVETPLIPILSEVELLLRPKNEQHNWRCRVGALKLERDAIFPLSLEETGEPAAGFARYSDLWDVEMRPELDNWKKASTWNRLTLEAYFVTVAAFLRKYLSFVASATPWQADEDDRVWPDVSLYDHLKVTAAIAACLRAGLSDDEIAALKAGYDKPVAILVRGDFSGIQNFIYRITRLQGEGEYSSVAKRLRGRSFYLQLLGDVVVDWLTRELGVTPANVLFCGGGRFDILAPLNARSRVQECEKKLEDWLLKTFFGELGMVIACVDVRPADFGNMRPVYDAADEELAELKRRKWVGRLMDETFLKPDWEKYHACPVCNITPVDEPQDICDQCRLHEKIGSQLPHVTHLAVIDGETWPQVKGAVIADFAQFDRTVLLLDERKNEASQVLAALDQTRQSAVIYRLNNTEDFLAPDAPPQVGQTFRFLANAAPVATQSIALSDGSSIKKGDVLSFELIAALSDGVKRMGVLKADVDRLGLIFGLGLEPPTISRVTALSGAIDLFFCGWLNKLCEKAFEGWQEAQTGQAASDKPVNSLYGKVDGLFYVMYSGGDDLFIVGPWDATLQLAQQLHDDFEEYACRNPNMTLSAGYVQVKPHYPVQRFAELVSEAEKCAKSKGRNRITVFGETVEWIAYNGLLEFARELCGGVESGKIPRTLVHDLGQMKYVRDRATDELKPLYSPRLHYALTRRIRDREVRDKLLQSDIISRLKHIMIPVSYVSLITRKE